MVLAFGFEPQRGNFHHGKERGEMTGATAIRDPRLPKGKGVEMIDQSPDPFDALLDLPAAVQGRKPDPNDYSGFEDNAREGEQ